MAKKRFTLSQNGTLHTVRDNVENKPLGVFVFKDNKFPVYFCFHKIIDLLNNLNDENEQLKKLLECSREEANDYCEELMGKDEFIRLYKRHRDEVIEENKQLQAKLDSLNDIDRNCYNCKHCSTYDEGPGYGFVSLCEKDCMNTDGYFDYEYHKFKGSVVCPLWEYDDDQ